MSNSSTIIERILIPHITFARALEQLEQCFMYSADKAEAEGLAILGESGTGKTSVLTTFQSGHKPTHGVDGRSMHMSDIKLGGTRTVLWLALLLTCVGYSGSRSEE